ncbi:hypothetical protein HID58_001190 [Brassica napus]|uniref:Uncharacterized protein n=1 Tax=Brassica napus TaxID=3708 RepID=A0ABQ8EJA5_BRANA|nr:hypothetical protein HID58_001190 [Brassica napus]
MSTRRHALPIRSSSSEIVEFAGDRQVRREIAEFAGDRRVCRRSRWSSSSGSAANGTVSQGPLVETPSHNPSPRGQNQRNGSASQTHGGCSDNFSPRHSHRNQNGNHHHHHHQSHGGRRSQEQGNQNWNFCRSFSGRDGNAHSQRGAPAFVRHQPPTMQSIPPQFMAAQPIQPFGGHVPFPPSEIH